MMPYEKTVNGENHHFNTLQAISHAIEFKKKRYSPLQASDFFPHFSVFPPLPAPRYEANTPHSHVPVPDSPFDTPEPVK